MPEQIVIHNFLSPAVIQTLVDHSRDILFALNERYQWSYLNPAWSVLTGYSLNETVSKSMNEFIHPDDRDTNLQKISALAKGDAYSEIQNVRICCRNGTYKPVQMLLYKSTLSLPDTSVVCGIMKVLHDLDTPDGTLRQRTEFQFTLLHDAPDIIYQTGMDKKFIYMNRSGLQTFGYAEEDLFKSTLDTIVLKEDFNRVVQFYERQIDQRVLNTYLEFRMVTQWGEWIWVGQHASLALREEQPVGLVCIARDITLQKKAEEELLASERRYWLAFESALHGIYFTDKKGIIRYVNPAMCALTGYSKEEVIGSPFLKFLEPTLKDIYARQFFELIGSRTPLNSEYMIRKKEGQRVIAGTQMYYIDLEGEPFIVTNVSDITAQRLLEKESEELRSVERKKLETLEEINKLKTRMLSAVSHEFRTPLSSIIGFTSTMLETSDLDMHTLKKYLHVVHQQGKRLETLVGEMLDLSLLESQRMLLRLQEIHVEEVLHEVIESLKDISDKKNIAVLFTPEKEARSIRGDRNRIFQVFQNIIENAIKYSYDKNCVHIATTCNHQGVQVTVRDSGIGIAEEDLDKVYDAFFRSINVSEGIPGTGLGLTITKEIIQAHQGTIQIQSNPGDGTTVTVFLPYSIQPTNIAP